MLVYYIVDSADHAIALHFASENQLVGVGGQGRGRWAG